MLKPGGSYEHINSLECLSLHLIARFAFPLFVVGVGKGLRHTRNARAYAWRKGRLLVAVVLACVGLILPVQYGVAFDHRRDILDGWFTVFIPCM